MAVDRLVEERVRRVLRSQNAVITYAQLREAGLTWSGIRAMVKRGSLTRLWQGMYAAVDPALLPLAREAAALLSLKGTVLSHRSAAVRWGITAEPGRVIHLTTPGHPRPRVGVMFHRVTLQPIDIRARHDLKLTSPARTLIDLAAEAGSAEMESAFGEARAKGLITDGGLEAALARAPRNHPGAAVIRRLLREDPGSTYTRSEAERRIRRLMKEAELPQPLVNFRLLGFTADFLWPEHRLILEMDGYGGHGDRLAFEGDRKRDQVHVAAGYTVIRVTWRQLRDEPLGVVARIAQALALRAP